jgi:hypothetical protein
MAKKKPGKGKRRRDPVGDFPFGANAPKRAGKRRKRKGGGS